MEKIKEEQLMRKIKLFPFPHVEIRISVSDEVERDNGSWKLKGVEWKQIKPGAVITVPVWEKL